MLSYSFFKRLSDIFLALIFLTFLIPIFLLIAVLIKLSSKGKIIFVQKRVGKNNKLFSCYKFRTMHQNSELKLREILLKSPEINNEFKSFQKITKDPRITHIGKFLRFTSLDELPQIFNVLKGEMSFIGPRPILKEEIKKYGLHFKEAFSVRPGISGLWQVNGRNKIAYKKRVAIDIFYSRNINFYMDIGIFFKTIYILLLPFGKGAY